MQNVKKERGATNAVISVLCFTLLILVVLTIYFLSLQDDSELASEELHNGTQMALSDAILCNTVGSEESSSAEFGRQYILETMADDGSVYTTPALAKHVSDTFMSALQRNLYLDPSTNKPTQGALHNVSSEKQVRVLDFFVVERTGDPNQAKEPKDYRIYPFTCVNGKVTGLKSGLLDGKTVSGITGNSPDGQAYLKLITGEKPFLAHTYPSGSTIYARVSFAAGGSTDNALCVTPGVDNNRHGSVADPDDKDGQLITFDDASFTRGKEGADAAKDPTNYHIGASVNKAMPAVAVTEIMDITASQNDAREHY